ncbi:MAG: HYR domain-containing protein [Verrucomicrobiae bacterium]|nr:HYR domain-containing protein [Verrucomicrobiae bacterium]
MKKITALVLFALFAAIGVRADLIWYEGFNYPNGAILTNTIIGPSTNSTWWRFSGNGVPSDMIVNNGRLYVEATGGSLVSRQDDCDRLFATTPGSSYTNTPQLVYASFTVICTNLPNGAGSYFASFYSGPVYNWTASGYFPTNGSFLGSGYCGRVQAFTNGTVLPNTWRLGVTDNGLAAQPANGGFPVDLATNVPYQVVEELDPITLQAATIWVNPINITQSGASTVDPDYTASDTIGFASTTQVNAFAFRQASSFGSSVFVITNLAVATTFSEAATNVWSTNALPPIIAYNLVGTTNFPGSSFNLSVVAAGQGLASLNYQWRENSNNVANPSGNSNILPFSSVPSNSGTNYYDVIVTTPYGLSVTSSPVIVAIDTRPQPPIITTQPQPLVLYSGQNAIFSVTIATPGNASFTWYSNNIPVTTGVSSSGYTSAIEIDNINPNNIATYKVAVTNDVFPNGVVSSGAGLTVKVPAAVSIGYLHTLVSPTTFLATNVPPSIAYQVTGIVTTYTNLTTGNTSSYYLQDASGGINIFVTGGSTFRPQLGDVISFVGVVSSFTSGLELYADTADSNFPFTSFTVLSNNIAGLPAARLISYNIFTNNAFANTNLGGLLVKLPDVHFGTRGGTTTSTSANDTVAITNSAGQVFNLVFPYLDLDVAGQTLPNYAYDVSGILGSASSVATNTIYVTRMVDLATTAPSIGVTNPANMTVTLVSGMTSTNVTFSLGGTGGCSTPGTKATPASGSAFTVGVTTVSCVATDACGDIASSSFTVTVNPPPTIIPTVPPYIGSVTLANGNVVITGTNAQATGVYYLLASTNVASPLKQWKSVATNVVGTTNNFTFIGTNAVVPGAPARFYILSSTNSNP